MTRGGNRGKVLPPTFPPFPPRLEIPQKTRASHIPTATTTAGLLLPPELNPQSLKKPNPSKIKGPVGFSCRAKFPDGIVKKKIAVGEGEQPQSLGEQGERRHFCINEEILKWRNQ